MSALALDFLDLIATPIPNSNTLFYTVAAILIFLSLKWLLYTPLDRVKRIGSIGYAKNPHSSLQKLTFDVRLRRKKGPLNPPYPNGWFSLLESSELKAGHVLPVDALGQHFAVFRGESGKVAILDAYCPHLGANLALGGKVAGDCLECPFHGWQYNKEGKCVKIPYAQKIPETAKTKAWPCIEHNKSIMVWFDAEGREPLWHPIEIPGVHTGNWKYSGKSTHIINAHIQEIPENGADTPHLIHLHGPSLFAGTDLRKTRSADGPTFGSVTKHTWEATWRPGSAETNDAHIAYIALKHETTLLGRFLSFIDVSVVGRQIGPGLVTLEFKTFFGDGVFLQTLTPLGPMEQKLTHSIWTEPGVPTWFAKIFLIGEAMQVERDIMIWNNKTFLAQPLLCAEDKAILQFRRWYKQFYSENSAAMGESNVLDW